MDSFFGIGPLELIFILIFALIFLGPERLPGAVRQIASFIRQIQKLSSTLTQQMGEEFGDIRELDPRYQLQQMMDEPDEKEKEAAKKAEEKKKEEDRKKEEAKKAEEKRKAEAKKKADEAKKKAEEAKAAAEKKAAEAAAEAALVADGQVDSAPAVAENQQVLSDPPGTETPPAISAVVENTIAPPNHPNHTVGEGSANGAQDGPVVALVADEADEIVVVKEEQA
jgi:Tat protein translocase TatB subunit